MHHRQRRNVTYLYGRIKKKKGKKEKTVTYTKNLTKNGESQRYIAGYAEEVRLVICVYIPSMIFTFTVCPTHELLE